MIVDFEAAVQEVICVINFFVMGKSVEKSNVQRGSEVYSLEGIEQTVQGEGHRHRPKHVNKTKLPKLSLPQFNGDPTKWLPFLDSFSSAIDENDDLCDVDKFQYLRSLLEGPAVSVIAGLSLTNSNYKQAVALLQDRYGNKEVIISKQIENLLQLPMVSDDDDLKRLCQLYNKTESTIRSLNGIGIAQETYGAFLAPTRMAKLPKELRLTISRKLSDEWDLKLLLNCFREELQLHEKCVLGTATAKEKRLDCEHVYRRQPKTTETFLTNSGKCSKDGTKFDFWCTFCKERFKEGGFNMRKWATNNSELDELICKEKIASVG